MANLTDSSAHAIEANAYTEAELANLLVVARTLPLVMYTEDDGDQLKRAGVSLTALKSLLELNVGTPSDFKLNTEDTISLLLLMTEALRQDVNSIESGAAGFRFVFSSSIAAADPSDGKFRFNNASPLSATALYVDNLDTEGTTVSGVIDSWDDIVNTGSRGTLVIRGVTDPTDFLVANITGSVTNSTGYRTVVITPVSGSGAFTNGETYLMLFTPAGADGSLAGSTGSTDNRILRADGTSGNAVQSSAATIDDNGNLSGVAGLTLTGTAKLSLGSALGDSNIAAGVLTIGTDGNTFQLGGTTTITGIADVANGVEITFIHTSARQLTYSAADLTWLGGANLTTAPGDTSIWRQYATGDWRLIGGTLMAKALFNNTATGFGASLIGVEASPSNYTAASADVEAHLAGIDAAITSGGGRVLLGSASPSGVGSVLFTGIPSTYKELEVVWRDLQPANDTVTLILQTSASSTPVTSGYSSMVRYTQVSSGVGITSTADTSSALLLCGQTGNASTEAAWGVARLQNLGQAQFTAVTTQFMMNNGSVWCAGIGGGLHGSATAYTEISIAFSGGNIDTGEINLYGITTS